MKVKRNPTRPRLKVTADGRSVVGHAGARLLSDLADGVGLTEALSVAMAPTKKRRRGHDRGQVLVDLAVMVAGDGESISDLATLRDQSELFGPVASTPTAWRALEAVDDAAQERIAGARARARAAVWAAGADPGFYVLDFDGTLVGSHSEKEGAAPTYKRGFGFHPLLCFLDATGEALAAILRPGNAGSNTTADHVRLLDLALAQLPVDPTAVEVVARADSAALTHGFVNACRAASVRFSIGHDLTEPIRNACLATPTRRWRPAVTADGSAEREGAEVAEITDLLDLSLWPERTRAIARREEPHPGAQLTSPTPTASAIRCSSPTSPMATSPTWRRSWIGPWTPMRPVFIASTGSRKRRNSLQWVLDRLDIPLNPLTVERRPVADQAQPGWRRDQFLLVLAAVIVGVALLPRIAHGMNVGARALTAAAPWFPAVFINDQVRRSEWTRVERLAMRLVLMVGGLGIAAAVLSRPATLP